VREKSESFSDFTISFPLSNNDVFQALMMGREVSVNANVLAGNTVGDGVNVAPSNPDEGVDVFERFRQEDEAAKREKMSVARKIEKEKKGREERVRIIGLKQTRKRKEYPSVDLARDTWVSGEVNTHAFIFLTIRLIIDLKQRINLTYHNNFD